MSNKLEDYRNRYIGRILQMQDDQGHQYFGTIHSIDSAEPDGNYFFRIVFSRLGVHPNANNPIDYGVGAGEYVGSFEGANTYDSSGTGRHRGGELIVYRGNSSRHVFLLEILPESTLPARF